MNKSKILIKWGICFFLGGILLLLASPVFADLSDDTNNLKSQWSGACAQSEGNAPGCGGGSGDTGSSSSAQAAPVPASAPVPAVPSAMEQAELSAAGQIGYSIGQSIGQALWGSPQTPAQLAAQQAQQQQIAAQQAYAAQQAAIAEEQRQEEIARQEQETHDRLVTEMKSDDGTSYGIKGLPGIYLNGPSGQSGQQDLQLMKDDDSSSSVPSSASPAVPPQAQDGLNLMKDDDNSSNAPPDDQSGQKAVDLSGVPIKDADLQADLPVADEIPENETYWKDRYPLDDQRTRLMNSHDFLDKLIAAHQAKCIHPDAACDSELKGIEMKVTIYQNDLKSFNDKVNAAIAEVHKNEQHITLDEMKYDNDKMNPKHDPDIQKGIDQRRIQDCIDRTQEGLSPAARSFQGAEILRNCKDSGGRSGLPPIDANGIRA